MAKGMDGQYAIEVKDVHKKFKIYYDKGRTLKERLLFRNRNHNEERWVLRGIDFKVKKGEAIGLIGENGAGKSTMLKLMTRIIYPDQGGIVMQGRVSSLIELGAGFHPDMSGRENIYTNASIFGLSRKEIDRRLQDIIDFSELEEFIDNPVRTYSSGMYMRLAFAVAINVDAEILLIDEILAVGDVNFQAKCFDKMREIKANGVTIVLVTHDIGTVERFCDTAVWLNDGSIASIGKSEDVIDDYMSFMSQKKIKDAIVEQVEITSKVSNDEIANEKLTRIGSGEAIITNVYLKNVDGDLVNILKHMEKSIVDIYFDVVEEKEYVIGIGIITLDNVRVFGTNTQLDRYRKDFHLGKNHISFVIDTLTLLEGIYSLQVAITGLGGELIDFHRDYMHFKVSSNVREVGIISLEHYWE